MRTIRVLVTVIALWAGAAVVPGPALASVTASDQQPAPKQPKQQEEFVPIDELPPQEQVPAAPMVVAAYIFVWVAFLAYVFTLVRRVKKVEADLAALEREHR
jgi:CcmD family protein